MRGILTLALAALGLLGSVAVVPAIAQTAPPNAINFQGRLATPSGNPVPDGMYSVRFRFYDAATAGNVLYEKTIANVQVKHGTFAATLSGIIPEQLNGNAWVGIQIGSDPELSPRQQIVSVPYAIKSSLALTVPDGSLTNSKIAAGTLTADRFAGGVLNSNVWMLGGNSGVTSGFLGTTDNQPLEFRVNGRRAMRYQYVEDTSGAYPSYYYRTINVLGGSEINEIGAGVAGATIAGGGSANFTSGTSPNRVTANFGTVGGGASNRAEGVYSTVGGGVNNAAGDTYAAIGGGNVNRAYGYSSTVPGGSWNSASGDYSFAAGRNARANHQGTFVWADSTNTGGGGTDFASTGPNQFLIRASNGVGINTNNPGRAILWVNSPSTTIGICAGNLAPDGAASFQSHRTTNTSTYHFACTNSGTDVFYVNGSGRPFGTGSYATISDARYKRNVTTLENALDAVLNLRGVTFDWDTEKWKERGLPEGRQIGFIAQEVEKVLPELVSTDKNGYKSVSYADAVPVLVEAVKTQNKKVETLSKENAELKARLDAIERALAELKANSK